MRDSEREHSIGRLWRWLRDRLGIEVTDLPPEPAEEHVPRGGLGSPPAEERAGRRAAQ